MKRPHVPAPQRTVCTQRPLEDADRIFTVNVGEVHIYRQTFDFHFYEQGEDRLKDLTDFET